MFSRKPHILHEPFYDLWKRGCLFKYLIHNWCESIIMIIEHIEPARYNETEGPSVRDDYRHYGYWKCAVWQPSVSIRISQLVPFRFSVYPEEHMTSMLTWSSACRYMRRVFTSISLIVTGSNSTTGTWTLGLYTNSVTLCLKHICILRNFTYNLAVMSCILPGCNSSLPNCK